MECVIHGTDAVKIERTTRQLTPKSPQYTTYVLTVKSDRVVGEVENEITLFNDGVVDLFGMTEDGVITMGEEGTKS